MSELKKARVIAYYLPQFHPIPENDEWWGKGFTEWTNVAKAKPLFKGHYQPRIPKDLGFYDLRLPEVREAQAELAKEAGIEGFCYWHYWFGNQKELLERPFNEVVKSGKPDFPFCLGWANHTWSSKTWKSLNTKKDTILIKQTYPGKDDHIEHFYKYLNAFNDKRYIKVDGRLLFVIFRPLDIPNVKLFINLWNDLAINNGLPGFFFVGVTYNTSNSRLFSKGKLDFSLAKTTESNELFNMVLNEGFDAVNSRGIIRAEILAKGKFRRLLGQFIQKKIYSAYVNKYNYSDIMKNYYTYEDTFKNVFPTILPQWDRSPRSGNASGIYHNSTPELFKNAVENALEVIKGKDYEYKILFLQSWNEWAEGNYMEPDLKYGKGYLNALKEAILY
ncbi:MAG: glycoside hydrolase family 99-like domain-containing protein [Lentimicrobiaceae bacterium]|nr:glycoside hydrolase family 99-like domain-containing protein [Lentimicrobiaceae bacterium]